MSISIKAPRLGEGVEELTVGKWLVREGENVVLNAPLLELESDKVVTELPSPKAGVVLRLLVREGDTVRVGDVLALVGEAGETAGLVVENGLADPVEPQLTKKSVTSAGSAPPPESTSSQWSGPALPRRFLSPLAKKLAAMHEVDLSLIKGTGLGGRVMKQDILDYVAARDERKGDYTFPLLEPQPHTAARSRIARRMVESMQISAQVLTVMEADMGAIIAHRTSNKEAYARGGSRLTLTAYFVVAAARALRAHPGVNSSWTDDGMILHPTVDIGLAVSLGEDGLLVPVVHKADTLSLKEVARVVDDLAVRSRSRKLRPDEVRGGTFTLTNHGSSGSLFATPIIVQPQVAILGIGAVRKRVVVVEAPGGTASLSAIDAIAIRPMAYLSLVFDHRVMDGEGADRFLQTVKSELEGWK